MPNIGRRSARPLWLGAVLLLLTGPSAAFAQTAAPAARCEADNVYQEGAILWTQTAGEARALAYQAFALARLMLDRDLRTARRGGKRRAVVVDADETVLDNSRFQAKLLKECQGYSSRRWSEWVGREEAEAIPGAVEFLRYAAARGVRVFYVTNRRESEKAATASNLKKLGFPGVSEETLLVRPEAGSSSKEPRRRAVAANYRIVLLAGDNLNDFAEVFEQSRTIAERLAAVERNRAQFGARFIVLPNVMYGDWESAVYGYENGLSDEQKAARRRGLLKTY
jgi:5'-nucleotidase (lipoprotein e(P4) family)